MKKHNILKEEVEKMPLIAGFNGKEQNQLKRLAEISYADNHHANFDTIISYAEDFGLPELAKKLSNLNYEDKEIVCWNILA